MLLELETILKYRIIKLKINKVLKTNNEDVFISNWSECSICYELNNNKYVQCQTCKNFFHYYCIRRWLSSACILTCPMCRTPWS